MRVAILTSGRFHVLDLARELVALGHDVRFHSLLPSHRTRLFGLPDANNRWLGPYVAPLYAAARAARGTRLDAATQNALTVALDRVAAKVIEPCDVFIGMSGMSLATIEAMRRRGTRVLLERGSRHMLSQRAILEAIPGAATPPDAMVHRELAEYALADTIVVPALHVVRSFEEYGIARSRLFTNPYGVSLDDFSPTKNPGRRAPTLLMVGNFSLRKGCDVLVEAVAGMKGVNLLHVGTPGDCPFPREPWFESVGRVPQSAIRQHHARAHVAVLASREEGMAVVQAQALASGLPLVCTDRTGGEDLLPFVRSPRDITVVPPDDVTGLRAGLEAALHRALRDTSEVRSTIPEARLAELSWAGYARRYAAFLEGVAR